MRLVEPVGPFCAPERSVAAAREPTLKPTLPVINPQAGTMPPHVHLPLLGGCPRAGCGTRSRRYNEHGEISRARPMRLGMLREHAAMPSFPDELRRTPDPLGVRGALDLDMCVFWSSLFYGEETLLDVFSGLAARSRSSRWGWSRCWRTS